MVEKKKRKGNGSWSLVALFNQDFQRVAFNPPSPENAGGEEISFDFGGIISFLL